MLPSFRERPLPTLLGGGVEQLASVSGREIRHPVCLVRPVILEAEVMEPDCDGLSYGSGELR